MLKQDAYNKIFKAGLKTLKLKEKVNLNYWFKHKKEEKEEVIGVVI